MACCKLKGKLTAVPTIRARLKTRDTIKASLTIPSVVNTRTYDGDYEVTPRVYEQSLDTGRKYMRDDVTVHEIPVTMTSNPEGGLTVLIG